MARIGNAVIKQVQTQQGRLWEVETYDLHSRKLIDTRVYLTKEDAQKFLSRYAYHFPIAVYKEDRV